MIEELLKEIKNLNEYEEIQKDYGDNDYSIEQRRLGYEQARDEIESMVVGVIQDNNVKLNDILITQNEYLLKENKTKEDLLLALEVMLLPFGNENYDQKTATDNLPNILKTLVDYYKAERKNY